VQLLEVRPDLVLVPVRGNVPTRADKARTGELEAVVLAAAGVGRLGIDLGAVRPFSLPPERFVPAPGQAALGLEARADDARLLEALAALHDPEVARSTAAERQLLHGLGAGCSVPLGAHALPGADGRLLLRAVLGPGGAHPRPRLRRALVRAPDPQAAAELALRVLDPSPAPLEGPALRGRRVLLLRDPARGDELVEALEALGAEARCRAATEPRPLLAPEQVRAAVRDLPRGSWVLLASPQAAQCFAAALDEPARAALFHLRLGAVGPGTARELAEADLPVDLLARRADGAGLAEELLGRAGAPPPAVLLPAARMGRAELGEALAAAGVRVERLALYATEPCPPLGASELEHVDALVLFAPSAARAALAGVTPPPGCALVAIGPTTAGELAFLGHPAREVADAPTPAGILAALGRVFAAH
jgi:hydroxymethylbilane synthase